MKTSAIPLKATSIAALCALLALTGCSTSGSAGASSASQQSGEKVNIAEASCPAAARTALNKGQDIVIGSSEALSGPVSAASQQMVPVINAVFAKVNADGGIDGHKLVFKPMDDAYEVARAVSNTTQLLNNDKVMATILQMGTAQTKATQQLHESMCVPQLSVSSGAPNFYDPANHPFSTSDFFPYSANGELMAAYLKKEFPQGAKIGELTWNNDFGTTSSSALTTAINGIGAKVVSEQKHDSTASSLSNQVSRLLGASPDALAANTGSSFCSQFVQLARQNGFNGPILLPYACSDASDVLLPLGAQAANVWAGQSLLDPADPANASAPGVQDYLNTMKTYANGKTSKSSQAAMAYQVAITLIEQLKRAAASKEGLSSVSLMNAVWSTHSEIGLDFPGHPTIINGLNPSPIGYAKMGKYDPSLHVWSLTDTDVTAGKSQP